MGTIQHETLIANPHRGRARRASPQANAWCYAAEEFAKSISSDVKQLVEENLK